MACGVPVVAARLGQIEEVVRDGETGLLYPPDEPEALTTACERLLTDPDLRHRLGAAAAKDVQGQYTWDQTPGAWSNWRVRSSRHEGRAHEADG